MEKKRLEIRLSKPEFDLISDQAAERGISRAELILERAVKAYSGDIEEMENPLPPSRARKRKKAPVRPVQLNLRVSEQEMEAIKDAAAKHVMSISEYCRTKILRGKDRLIVVDTEVSGPLFYELGKQGANINQAARALNELLIFVKRPRLAGSPEEPILRACEEALVALQKDVDEIESKTFEILKMAVKFIEKPEVILTLTHSEEDE